MSTVKAISGCAWAATTRTTAATWWTARGCSALFGDVATELCIRHDGDEGLFRAYDSVEFLAPVYAGDFIEAEGEIVSVGNTQPEDALRGAQGDPAAAGRERLGGGRAAGAGGGVPRDGHLRGARRTSSGGKR